MYFNFMFTEGGFEQKAHSPFSSLCSHLKMKEDLKLSEFVKKTMWRVMKYASSVEQGFLFFRHRVISVVELDLEECQQLLKDMIINEQNVLTYLKRKYIPTFVENGAVFKDQNCIQKAILKKDYLLIYINKSEPHKIITDTIHVKRLLEEKGFVVPNKIKFFINQLQIAFQDTLLYNLLLTEFGTPPPSVARTYEKQLLFKYKNLENVAKIKKRSVKRKFLRWRVKREELTWKELRRIINIEDFSPKNIRMVCNEIREAAKERGVKVTF